MSLPSPPAFRTKVLFLALVLVSILAGSSPPTRRKPAAADPAQAAQGASSIVIEKGDFRFACDERGVSALANPRDPFKATLMPAAGPRGGRPPVLGLTVGFRADETGEWTDIVPRGPWRYDGEIDLGYGGALRMAATVVAHDPVFGWIAYGGTLVEKRGEVAVEPRDGVRRRFAAVLPGASGEEPRRLKIELERDGFAAGKSIAMDKSLAKIVFTVENRTADAHKTGLRISVPAGSEYELVLDGRPVPLSATGDWDHPWRAEIEIDGPTVKVEVVRKDGRIDKLP